MDIHNLTPQKIIAISWGGSLILGFLGVLVGKFIFMRRYLALDKVLDRNASLMEGAKKDAKRRHKLDAINGRRLVAKGRKL